MKLLRKLNAVILFTLLFSYNPIFAAGKDTNLLENLECMDPKRKDLPMSVLSKEEQQRMKSLLAYIAYLQLLKKISLDDYQSAKTFIQCANDPDAIFSPANSNTEIQAGLGIIFGEANERTTVKAILSNSNAIKAGLKSGDKIISINGTNIEKKQPSEINEILYGEEGSTVKLKIQRASKTMEVEAKRQFFKINKIETRLDENFWFIKVAVFDREVLDQLIEISQMIDFKKGIILDLRFGFGGTVDDVNEALSLFLPKGTEWLKMSTSVKEKIYVTNKTPIIPSNVPLVIIVNRATSAGSEVFATNLREFRNAKIIGEQMSGNYDLQQKIIFKSGTSVTVKVATMLKPSGKPFTEGGELPDIKVRTTGNNASRDTAYLAAKKYLESLKR